MGRRTEIQTDILTALRGDLFDPADGQLMAEVRVIVFGNGTDADKVRAIQQLLA